MTDFTLPFPPSVNQWKTPFRGRMILTKRGREYRAAVADHLLENKVACKSISGPVAVDIIVCQPDRRKRDLDNLLKSPLDALTHAGFWCDDSQVVSLKIRWGENVKGGLLNISVYEIETDPAQVVSGGDAL